MNKNSIHARLYRFTYPGALPENLCPYFWKVILAVLFFIPNSIFQGITVALNQFFPKDNRINEPIERMMAGAVVVMLGSLVTGVIYFEIQWFKYLFNAYSYNSLYSTIGGCINFVLIGCILYWIINTSPSRKSESWLIKEFIKAKYHKYCPKIDWK